MSHFTLDDLHYWIGRAFDMDNDHLWEFYVGPRRPYVRTGRITCGEMGDYGDVERIAWEVTLEDLKLRPRKTFYYVFDFGDSWWYKISVVKLKAPLAEGAEYPRIVERIGKSPEQYPVYDDDEDDEDEVLHCWRAARHSRRRQTAGPARPRRPWTSGREAFSSFLNTLAPCRTPS